MQARKLSELPDWKLHDSDQDVRGQVLKTASGASLGTIRDMMVDTEAERVESVVLEDGRAFPVEGLELREQEVITYDAASPPAAVGVYTVRLIRPESSRM